MEILRKSNYASKTIETSEGVITCNGIEIKNVGSLFVQINGDEYNIAPELQAVFTNTKGDFLQKCSNGDKLIFWKTLKSLKIEHITPKRGETY